MKPKPFEVLFAAFAVTAALALAACGGDDEEPDSGATGATGATGTADVTPIPLSEWTTEADEICADGSAQIDDAAREQFPDGQPGDQEASQFVAETVVPGLQAQHDQIAALPPPEGSEAEAEALLTALQQGIAAIEADPSAALGPQDSAQTPFGEANQLADQLGLNECGED